MHPRKPYATLIIPIPWSLHSFSLRAPKGPLLVLISPCFREDVNVTCKIVSFLCSLDNFLLKNAVVFFFGNQISKWRSFEKKKVTSDLLFTREKTQKWFLQHISHLHTYTYFAHPIDFFCLPNFAKIVIYHVWFLFGVPPGFDSCSRHFGAINKQNAKFRLECLLYCTDIYLHLWKIYSHL